MSVIIGIDVGASTTKIVGFDVTNGKRKLIEPQFVKANDPITSIYGAFGKFTDENKLSLSSIDKIMMTGVGSAFVKNELHGIKCIRVPEFRSIGLGGLYLSRLDEALCVSMGTGTALVHAAGDKVSYLGGTGVGGGTLLGLSRLMLGADSVEHIFEMADRGDLSSIDLRIGDITRNDNLTELSRDLTASNFGNVSDIATKDDISAGIVNMIFETVGMLSAFGARSCGAKNVVLTGNLTAHSSFSKKIEQFNAMFEGDGIRFIIPEHSAFATVIGTALCG